MGLVQRCSACRKAKVKYSARKLGCDHPEKLWAVHYRIGSRRIFKTVGKNKREAERYFVKIKSEVATSGSFQDIRPITFKELSEKWLNNHKQAANPKPATIWTYDAQLRIHLLPLLGQKIVSQVTAYDLEIVKQKLRERVSARYTNAMLVTTGTILKYGLTLGFSRTNPAQLVKKYKVPHGAAGTTVTPEEAATFLKHLNEPFRTIFFTMFCTGGRVGEIIGLMWKDINYKDNLISIERNVTHAPRGRFGMGNKSWIFGTPKSRESTRKVFMIPALKTALLRHSERSQGNDLGLVFCTKHNQPYDRSTLREKADAVIKAANLKYFRLHDTRHSNATWLLASGINLAYVSKHLGHSGVAITGDTYYHVQPKEHERSMKLMDSMFPIWVASGMSAPPPLDESRRD